MRMSAGLAIALCGLLYSCSNVKEVQDQRTGKSLDAIAEGIANGDSIEFQT